MDYLQREIEQQVLGNLSPNKVIILQGARRIGKTVLLEQIREKLKLPSLVLNGEDFATAEMLARRTVANYKKILGKKKVLIIDEAQKIPEIGKILKLMVDGIKGLHIIVTGSSAFDARSFAGEPLTGRKRSYYMFALSERELRQVERPTEHRDGLRERLIFGNYPELLQYSDDKDKAEYLNEIINSYLLRDVLAFENIRSSTKLIHLLRHVAFHTGKEISYQKLGAQLSMSKNTVEKYLELLANVFVIHKVEGLKRKLKKEITKTSRWYFYDNGLRNVLIANVNPLEQRYDRDQLWENYLISERLKQQHYSRMTVNNYFWRTYDHQGLDWVEERGGRLHGYRMLWDAGGSVNAPTAWKKTYPKATFELITPDNYEDWLGLE